MANWKAPLIHVLDDPADPGDGNGYLWESARRIMRTYGGGPVNRFMVDRALDFLVLVDIWATAKTRNPAEGSFDNQYDACVAGYQADIDIAMSVLRRYGEQNLGPLQAMQEKYYATTNAWRYTRDIRVTAAVRSVLTDAWHEIGEWRK